ncbi:phosphoethanolamine N-methyltransferase [Phlegmacium glaucopus]|nr:phosphoethanolamine N-methyltransferase [Phlegmacium glaucopus]
MLSSRLCLLIWVFSAHLAGIYLFTRGFLLTRLSLSDASGCSSQNCNVSPIHTRAVFLIIDALRFDFVTPNPPSPASPFHHNILTLPQELTKRRPNHSFIFNSYADPPTTTLQRIKGITTGSLPTFVDLGNNFGGSSIVEDSILKQLKLAGKKLAFMGDDTWMPVFPDTFETNMTFPYDSFNVEDLHAVDEGVIKHLFPLLEDPSKPFDFLIGHFLGVDHVGHRVGPDHPSMKAKLQQMNNVLMRVVEKMDDDTLLVVMGDHGMDRSGDHGGDGILETSSAMWIYSKGHALIDNSHPVPSGLLQFKTFPETTVRHRSIQQIDILPTISLLLGLPIPYNNLGTVIPEVFWRGRKGQILEDALHINAAQIKRYLDTYRSSPSGGELDEGWRDIQSAWTATQASGIYGETKLVTLMNFNRVALATCRAMWAQFNPILMSLGLLLLGMGLCATWSVYSGLSTVKEDWDQWLTKQLSISLRGGAGGAVLGFLGHLGLTSFLPGVDSLDCVVFAGSLLSAIALVLSTPPNISSTLKSTPVILILHTVAFLSNSFTFWEDRMTGFFLVSSIVPYALVGFSAPNKRLRYRILGFSFLFAVCVRLISISTVCREEQQPYCNVTFYASSSSPPLPVLVLAVPVAMTLPYVIKKFMQITRSDRGVSKVYLPVILASSLIAGSLFWLMEWADSATILGDDWNSTLRTGRTWLARLTFGWIFFVGSILWWLVPLCLDIDVADQGEKRQIQVIGYANAFGSPYLIFWTLSLSLISISTQLTGQLVLALATVALIAFLEVLDSVRDVKGIEAAFVKAGTPSAVLDPVASSNLSPPVQFMDVIPLALLGIHAFHGTGHQSTISSLQWKSAFLLTPTVTYPFSPITVVLNSVGPIFLMALGAPLLALWNRAPLASLDSAGQIKRESTLASLGMMVYYTALLLGTSVSAAILRRHLMVWKVFAPRFMVAVLELLTVDVAVVLGVGVGVQRVAERVSMTAFSLKRLSP